MNTSKLAVLSPFSLKGDAKLQSVKGFSLFLVLNPDMPHGGVKTFMTGEVFSNDDTQLLFTLSTLRGRNIEVTNELGSV